MAGIYVSIGGPSGSVASSNDVTNDSTVAGATVTDALDTLGSGVITKYIPTPPITLTSTDITNEYIILDFAPTDKDKTQLTVLEGIMAIYGTDFVVTNDFGGKKLTWAGLGLAGLLAAGDKIFIAYN